MTDPSLQSTGSPDEPDSRFEPFVALDAETDEPPDTPWLRDELCAVCRALDLQRAALNAVIIADPKMIEFNRRYCGIEGTTDVLAFDLRQEPEAPPSPEAGIDGELYLCLDEARRCAERYGHPVEHELLLYATHGLLHLLGYDDQQPDQHQRMHEREDELLRAMGVGPVYARSEAWDGGNQP
jgi:probable rRNA maturation factor